MYQKMTIIRRYTLRDVYELLSNQAVPLTALEEAPTFTETCVNAGYSKALVEDKKTLINECFKTYLYPILYNGGVVDIQDAEMTEQDAKEVFGQMLYAFLRSYQTYAKSIETYETMKDNLTDNLDTLVNENIARYNDTPQEAGDYSTEEYTTTINKVTETRENSQKALNIDKVIMVQQKLTNTYQIWANEMLNRFIIL